MDGTLAGGHGDERATEAGPQLSRPLKVTPALQLLLGASGVGFSFPFM